jgi:hypothetical protein
MKQHLARILSTMVGNAPAILRYKNADAVETKLVEITDHKQGKVICCLQEGEILPAEKRNVTLIINNNHHYLHCHGEVSESFLNGRLVSMELVQAALFIRKKRKDISWLEQLYKYESTADA